MPPRPTLDGAPTTLTLHTPEPRTCLFGRFPLSSLPPGVHWLGPHPVFPDEDRFELVSDDGRRLQEGKFPRAFRPEYDPYFHGWRDELSAALARHRCPDCAPIAPLPADGAPRLHVVP